MGIGAFTSLVIGSSPSFIELKNEHLHRLILQADMKRMAQPTGLRIAQVLPRRSPTAVQPLNSRRSASNNATEGTAKEPDQNSAKV